MAGTPEFEQQIADSRLRPVDWRWQDGVSLRQYLTSLEAEGNLDTGCTEQNGCSDIAAEEFARELQFGNDVWGRCILQARILTGDRLSEIARQTGLSWKQVAAFNGLFYDAKEKFQYGPSVESMLIGRLSSDGSDLDHDLEVALRHYAYSGGTHVLNAMLSAYPERITPTSFHDAALDKEIESRRKTGVLEMVETFTTPTTQHNAAEWLAFYAEVAELQANSDDRPRGSLNIQKTMKELRKSATPKRRKPGRPVR